jgi:hypothetical protein
LLKKSDCKVGIFKGKGLQTRAQASYLRRKTERETQKSVEKTRATPVRSDRRPEGDGGAN